MTKLKYLYVSIIIALLLVNCGTQKKISQSISYADSVNIVTVDTQYERDTVVVKKAENIDRKKQEVTNIEIVEKIVDLDSLQRPKKIVERTIKIDQEKRDTISNSSIFTFNKEKEAKIADYTAFDKKVIEDIVVNEKVEKKGVSSFSMGILTGIIIVITLILIWLYLRLKIKI